jgi:hypothetical protein
MISRLIAREEKISELKKGLHALYSLVAFCVSELHRPPASLLTSATTLVVPRLPSSG